MTRVLSLAVLPGRVDLISSSVVGFPFGSLESLQVVAGNLLSIPSSFTEVPIHLDVDSDASTAAREQLYITASVWPLESSLAPPGRASPSLGTIYPGDNTSKPGGITMTLCISILIAMICVAWQVCLFVFPALGWVWFSCSFA